MSKTVVVTGVTGGIGSRIAQDLALEGYFVIGLYRSDDVKASELEKSRMIKTVKCDITSFEEVDAVSKEILKNNNVFAVINNAGVSKTSLFTDVGVEDYEMIMDTNVKGAFLVTKAFLPNMINKKCGKIVNISSIWGVSGGSCEVVYSASKSALIGMTKALSREVGPSGITVNCIAPGVIETKMLNNLSEDDKKALAESSSLMRNGTPKDISGIVSFLLSEKADFITGQTLIADGGLI